MFVSPSEVTLAASESEGSVRNKPRCSTVSAVLPSGMKTGVNCVVDCEVSLIAFGLISSFKI